MKDVFSHSDSSFPLVDANDFCVFCDEATKKCLIHAVKLEACGAGPMTFDINCRLGKVEWYLKKSSLCLLAGKLCETLEEIYEHLTVAKNEIMQLIRKLDSEALRAILTRDEPETFKIGERRFAPRSSGEAKFDLHTIGSPHRSASTPDQCRL